MIKNSLFISLFILLSLNGSDREDSNVSPLKREDRLNLTSSKEYLDKEVEQYFKMVEKPYIPIVKSSSDLDDDFN